MCSVSTGMGQRRQHLDRRAVCLFLQTVTEKGFSYTITKNGAYRFLPPHSCPQSCYYTHLTRASMYAIQREFKHMYNVSLELDAKVFK